MLDGAGAGSSPKQTGRNSQNRVQLHSAARPAHLTRVRLRHHVHRRRLCPAGVEQIFRGGSSVGSGGDPRFSADRCPEGAITLIQQPSARGWRVSGRGRCLPEMAGQEFHADCSVPSSRWRYVEGSSRLCAVRCSCAFHFVLFVEWSDPNASIAALRAAAARRHIAFPPTLPAWPGYRHTVGAGRIHRLGARHEIADVGAGVVEKYAGPGSSGSAVRAQIAMKAMGGSATSSLAAPLPSEGIRRASYRRPRHG